MSSYRVDRMSEDIKREVIAIMRELKDPRVAKKILTVVKVEVSSDMSYAKVYVSAMDGIDSAKEAVLGLKSAAGFVRHQVGMRLPLRISPELSFVADNSVEKGIELFEKLKDANK